MKTKFTMRLALTCIMAAASQVLPLKAGTVEPASAIDASLGPPVSGGGDSFNPIVTPDGRYVLFSSRANNLVVSGAGAQLVPLSPPKLNVFLRDRSSGETRLISVNVAGTGGANGDSIPRGISTNGQWVLFESTAPDLVAQDTNDSSDVFLRDLLSGSTLLVSANTNGNPGNARSWESVMTPDGRYVAFSSLANDLVAQDTNGIPDMFVRDTASNRTVWASPGTVRYAGATFALFPSSNSPEISPDGSCVVFIGPTTNIIGINSTNLDPMTIRNLNSDTTRIIATGTQGILAGLNGYNYAYNHNLSEDGQYLVFQANHSSSLAGRIVRYNLVTGGITLIATNGVAPKSGHRHFRSLDISPDGRFVVYVGKTGNAQQVYLWDAQIGSSTLVTVNTNNAPAASANFDYPAVDASGRLVAFLGIATDLTTNAVAPGYHLYVRDLQAGTTRLIDQDANGFAAAKDFLSAPQLTPDGRLLAFDCTDGTLVLGDNNNAYDVFICDLTDNSIELVSRRHSGLPSQTPSAPVCGPGFSVSSDGRYVAFASSAGNLVPNNTNAYPNIFIRDLARGTNTLGNPDVNGLPGANGVSLDPMLSGDGRFVAFTSSATNLVVGDTNANRDVFVRDLRTGATFLASLSADGASPGNGASSLVRFSGDGRFVLYRSRANNLVAGSTATFERLFWRSMPDRTNAAVTQSPFTSADMTSDGRFVAYAGANGNIYVWDALLGAGVYTNVNPAVSLVAVSPDGNRIAGLGRNQLVVADRSANTNGTLATSAAAVWDSHSSLQFNADGRFLVYATTLAPSTQDLNSVADVYVYDFLTQSNMLISAASATEYAADGPSDSAVISPDGRFIAYRSRAANLVAGDTNTVADVFLYDLLSASTTLISASTISGSAGNNTSLAPVFSADGRTLLFQSWASDLVSGDFNQAGELFAIKLGTLTNVLAAVGQIVFVPGPEPLAEITWEAQERVGYRVEYKNDLTDPMWQNLNCTITVVGARAAARDLAPGANRRFYRIVAF